MSCGKKYWESVGINQKAMKGEGRGGDDDDDNQATTPLLQSTVVASSSDEPLPPDPPLKKRTGNLADSHLAHFFEKSYRFGKAMEIGCVL